MGDPFFFYLQTLDLTMSLCKHIIVSITRVIEVHVDTRPLVQRNKNDRKIHFYLFIEITKAAKYFNPICGVVCVCRRLGSISLI